MAESAAASASAVVDEKDLNPATEEFPVGLRVLVVDDDHTCLKVLERMLRICRYRVTTCSQAKIALKLLREKKGECDLVLSDVYMPDMDGFKLLELIGLEMDLPVIMISADDGKDVVMKGVIHGACDYLIKPVSIQALQNIWQHVVRKRRNEISFEHTGSVKENEKLKKSFEDGEHSSSLNEGSSKTRRKKEDKEEEDESEEKDDPSSLKKPRVIWSMELHQQFVTAVSQLGVDKAVPKKILELMNVPGLSRENVASHLQKFRLYLRRINAPQNYARVNHSSLSSMSLDGFDIRTPIPRSLRQNPQMNLQIKTPPRVVALGRRSPMLDPSTYKDPYKQVSISTILSPQSWNSNQLNSVSRASSEISPLPVIQYGNRGLQVSQDSSGFSNSLTSLPKLSSFHEGITSGLQKTSATVPMTQPNCLEIDLPWLSQSPGWVPSVPASSQESGIISSISQKTLTNEVLDQTLQRCSSSSLNLDTGAYLNPSTGGGGGVSPSLLSNFESGFMTDPFGTSYPPAEDVRIQNLSSTSLIRPVNETGCEEALCGGANSGLKGGNFLSKFDLSGELFQNSQRVNPAISSAQNSSTISKGTFSVRTDVEKGNILLSAPSQNRANAIADMCLQGSGFSVDSYFDDMVNKVLKQHEGDEQEELDFNIDAYSLDDFSVSFATS